MPRTTQSAWAAGPAPVSSADIQNALRRILASGTFSRCERMKRFLEFTVSIALEAGTDVLKEYSIAVAVFDKSQDFDPRLDPIVRVEAGRLRAKLKQYYETEGRQESTVIHFPKGSYVPQFQVRMPEPDPGSVREKAAFSSLLGDSDRPIRQEIPLESIAVLPFADLSPKQDLNRFCDGLTEELINLLSRIEELKVAARTSVMQFKDTAGDIRGIGRQLNVHTVLEGSVRKDGPRIRILTQAVSVSDGYNLWSDVYNRELDGIIDVQQSIAQSIIQALSPRSSKAYRNSRPSL